MLKIQKKQIPTLIGDSISSILVGMSWPVLHKSLMTVISSRLISLEQILCLAAIMVTSIFWDKIQKWMISHYVKLEVIESIILTTFYLFFIFHWDPKAYYIADIFYYVIIGSIFGRCGSACRTLLFPEKQERIDSDAARDFFSSATSILGFAIAIFVVLPINLCLWAFLIADIARTMSVIFTCTKYKSYLEI